jgi:(E)-4-hydroxy-3-methylbut-2-enyl-diphosphate synthase
VVNGPGEARETDIGVTGGSWGKNHMVYVGGLADHRIDDGKMIDHVVELVERKAAELEAARQAAE